MMEEREGILKEIKCESDSISCVIMDELEREYGTISLESIDFENRSAELIIKKCDMNALQHEVGVSVINQMLYHAFSNMKLQRISNVVVENEENILSMYEAAGFVREGIVRSVRCLGGTFANGVLCSILKDEYKKAEDLLQEKLPDYCIQRVSSLEQKRNIMKACEGAFNNHANLNVMDEALVRKIDALADFFVAYNTKILGYVAIYANDIQQKIAYITLIAVRPEFQKKYIGNRLLQKCVEITKQRGMKGIKLEVNNDNKGAIAFYKRNGFQYMSDCTENSSYMYMNLS